MTKRIFFEHSFWQKKSKSTKIYPYYKKLYNLEHFYFNNLKKAIRTSNDEFATFSTTFAIWEFIWT